jgi:hypothetical protein
MEPVIIDNFLTPRYFSRLKEIVENTNFVWYFQKCITYPNSKNDSLYSFGFDNHVISNFNVVNDYLFNFLSGFYSQLLDVTECSGISKSRFDMVTHSPVKHQHTIHVDEFFNHIASVFYITDSDAETIIYDQQCFSESQYIENIDFATLNVVKKIKPKENRLLFFDGSYLHTGCSPAEYKNRIIINTDLVK